MAGSGKVSRVPPMKTGAALLVAAVLSIGAMACGSASDSTGSASTVPNKEAGGTITVPHLIGLSNFEAEGRANSVGLSVHFQYLSGDGSGKGIVVDQSPPPGAEASPGQSILLVIK